MNSKVIRFKKASIAQFAAKNTVFLVFLLLIVVSSLASNVFLSVRNFTNILRQVSVTGLLACGMTFVILTGGFDLSVGSIVSICSVIAIGGQQYFGVGLTLVITLIVSIIFGTLNGFIMAIVNGKAGEAFMITLGTMIFYQGIALFITNGRMLLGSESDFYNSIGQGMLFDIMPYSVLIFLLFIVASQFLLTKTLFGRKIYLTGGNYEAARLSGINVKFYKMITYSIVGFTSSFAAIILSSRTHVGTPVAGLGYEFDAIAAVIVGGTSLSGGEGSVLKTLLGVLIIGILNNILNLIGLSPYSQMIVKGVVIVAAVWLNSKQMKFGGEKN